MYHRMSIKALNILVLILSVTLSLHAQDTGKMNGDDTASGRWPKDFLEIQIPSSSDGSRQKAMFYRARSRTARPLIVSLHSWREITGRRIL